MSASSQEPVRLVAAQRRPARGAGRRVYLALVVAVVIATAVAIASSRSRSASRRFPGVAPDERTALLSRTVEDLRRFCGAGRPPDLEDHCRELASFASRFDECRGECEALVRPLITPTPTR